MRVLIVDTYYSAFLKALYGNRPDLVGRPYEEQLSVLMDACFGTADFYSANLKRLGHEAVEVVANCRPMQLRWAREHDMRLGYHLRRGRLSLPVPELDWTCPILLAQVEAFRPDVIHFQNPCGTDRAFLKRIRPLVKVISAQIASPISAGSDFRHYDVVFSSFPHFVRRFGEQGIPSAYLGFGFEPRVLDGLRRADKRAVVFVGGVSGSHTGRLALLEHVARHLDLDWWGYGVGALPSDSALRKAYRGPAWGVEMYQKLYSSQVTLNHHIDTSEDCANNMRLFEATGVGTMLLTDWKANLASMFEVGKEVVAYRSAEECVELIEHYLAHEAERQSVAGAGQRRTLRDHTYLRRMQQFADLLKPLMDPMDA